MIFFTSDLHLGHARINELAGRPFASTAEADAAMVDRWNSVVGDDDLVVILGDVAMGDIHASLEKVATLNGTKFLVPGNHDRVSHLYRTPDARRAEWRKAYEDAGLLLLGPEVAMILGSRPVILHHFPYDGDSHDEDRYAAARPRDRGEWLLHGHTHSRERIRGRQVHVGVDAWDFTPVSAVTLKALIEETEAA